MIIFLINLKFDYLLPALNGNEVSEYHFGPSPAKTITISSSVCLSCDGRVPVESSIANFITEAF